jgi:type II secretory pathway pseudopilin PulG
MKAKHAGITLISFLIVLLVVGFFAYMAMKLFPAYTEFMGVQKAMNDIATESMDGKSQAEIRNDLIKKLNYQYVSTDTIQPSDITIGKGDQGVELQVSYDKDIPFMFNIDFLVHFEKSVPLQGNIAAPQ